MTTQALFPGAVHVVNLETTLEGSAPWAPNTEDSSPIDLVGEGFTFGRDFTGTYYSLFYDAGLNQEDYDSRRDFLRTYVNWPIAVRAPGVNSYHYLHAVESEVPSSQLQIFGQVQLYVRSQHDGTQSEGTGSSIITFSGVQALRAREGTPTFPAVGEEPIISDPEGVSFDRLMFKVTDHQITDVVRSPDDEVLISSQQIVEGYIGITGPTAPAVGINVTVASLEGEPEFRLVRLNRVDPFRALIRLERDLTSEPSE